MEGLEGIKFNQSMKLLRAKARVEAFTLVEILVVVAMIVMLWVMIMPEPRAKPRSLSTACINNQKQIELGFATWAGDNENRFPWQVSTNEEGTKEFISDNQAVSQFQSLSHYLKDPQIFFCPSEKTRIAAIDNIPMNDSNISYFVNVDAALTSGANTIMTGDRHLQANGNQVNPGTFVYTNGMAMGWTRELHYTSANGPVGAMSFTDGHVERVVAKTNELTDAFNQQKIASERLLVP